MSRKQAQQNVFDTHDAWTRWQNLIDRNIPINTGRLYNYAGVIAGKRGY